MLLRAASLLSGAAAGATLCRGSRALARDPPGSLPGPEHGCAFKGLRSLSRLAFSDGSGQLLCLSCFLSV